MIIRKDVTIFWAGLLFCMCFYGNLIAWKYEKVNYENITFENTTGREVVIQFFCKIDPEYRACYRVLLRVYKDSSYRFHKVKFDNDSKTNVHDFKQIIAYFPNYETKLPDDLTFDDKRLLDYVPATQSYYLDGSVAQAMKAALKDGVKAETKFRITTKKFPGEGYKVWLEKIN